MKAYFEKIYSIFWLKFYKNKFKFFQSNLSKITYKVITVSIILLTLFLISNYIFSSIEDPKLSNLFLNTGTALIGASAIVFTLIIFTLQVNIERMPYGLFNTLSSDKKILISFILTILLSLSIAVFSVLIDQWNKELFSFLYLLFISSIVNLFLLAYKRALHLINPIKQLDLLKDISIKDMHYYLKIYKKIATSIVLNQIEKDTYSKHDLRKYYFFENNSQWLDIPKNTLKYTISLIILNTKNNDYEVIEKALNTLIETQNEYIKVKENTFFTNNILSEDKKSHDPFINDLLEELRIAKAEKNELLIEKTLLSMSRLSVLYSSINYNTDDYYHSKYHMELASSYLNTSIRDILELNMTDVFMECCIFLENTIYSYIKINKTMYASTSLETMSILASLGTINKKHQPIINSAFSCFSRILYSTIYSEEHINEDFFKELEKNIFKITFLYISLKEKDLFSLNSYLDPYYSVTNSNSFSNKLSILIETIINIHDKDSNCERIISNIEIWSDSIKLNIRELLKLSIEKSIFLIDLMQWIQHITVSLIWLSSSPNCSTSIKNKLINNAFTIIHSITFIPNNRENFNKLQNIAFTDIVFNTIINAYKFECYELANSLIQYLIKFSFDAIQLNNNYNFIQDIVYILIICINKNYQESYFLINYLKNEAKNLNSNNLQKTKEELNKINTYNYYEDSFGQIGFNLTKINRNIKKSILEEILNSI
ncbi:hypothetical protein ACOTVK_05690 [Aliarcobacter butzleri]